MTNQTGLKMPMLAIELSQRSGGVAFTAEGVEPIVVPVRGGRRDKDDLLPAIRTILRSAETRVQDLSTVAVDIGPGGFTGLRVSIAAAQMLAEIADASVVGVPGAEVAAAATPGVFDGSRIGRLLVISATRNGTAWTTRLRREDPDADWRPDGDSVLLEELPSDDVDVVLADEHLDSVWRDRLEARGVEIIEPVHSALGLAELLRRSMTTAAPSTWWISGDAATLRPIYPREPEAVRLWKARASR